MKNIILAMFSVLCVSYATNAIAQSAVIEGIDDGAILIDDVRTDIVVRNGALYINNIKISDLDEATQLRIMQRNADGKTSADAGNDIKFRVYNKAMLGVTVEDARPSIKITSIVAGSAADKAGLQPGDIITSIDGQNVIDFNSFTNIMAQHNVGDQIKIAYYHHKSKVLQKITTTLTENTLMDRLETIPNVYPIAYQGLEKLFDIPVNEILMSAYEINPTPWLGLVLEENTNGLEVVSLDSAGVAAKAGIQVGNIINMVQGRKVMTLNDLKTEIESYSRSAEVQLALSVFQGGQNNRINLNVPKVKRRGSF